MIIRVCIIDWVSILNLVHWKVKITTRVLYYNYNESLEYIQMYVTCLWVFKDEYIRLQQYNIKTERKYLWYKVSTAVYDHGIRIFSELSSTKCRYV